jgi:ribosome-binding factor A
VTILDGYDLGLYDFGFWIMATDRRIARVAEMIRREVSQLLFSGIKDDRVGMGMVSVTHVDVAGDLQHAKVFVSIYGTDEAKSAAMAGLKSATGFVRSELGSRMRLRRTPEILFVEDASIEQGTKVLSLINRLSEERKESDSDDLDPDPA